MADFLFATLDAGGNIQAVLGVARELAAREHRVRVLSHEAQRRPVADAGLEFDAYRSARPWDPRGSKSTLSGLLELIAVQTDQGIAQDVVAAIRADRPDVVIVDCMLLGTSKRLLEEGIAHATLFHSLLSYWAGPYSTGPIGIVGRLLGAGDPRRIWANSQLQLACTDPELDRPSSTLGREEWVGPVHNVTTAATPPESPRVLVSLSTVGYPGLAKTMQKVLDACREVPAEFVVTTGPAVDPAVLHAPPNATLHRYVDHGEIMPTCTAVIGHGGHSTAMRALAHGLPLLILPMHPLIDQPLVGNAIAEAGAGLVVNRLASTSKIRNTLRTLLDTNGFHETARTIGTRLRHQNGARRGADALERTPYRNAAVGLGDRDPLET